ncbi:nuclear pore protein 84/107 [Dimargaris cristalligena]|uniref:Nuclear pore complex protein n=1 Tax=Dimargaris cristalligena TaxID=215637 RepID=A0A4P9ZUF4_9FUNG|nr:nuclear pore protein 84/107 [Dimargaris cristalligena]|eukprot:RKP36422.1 nuclear pore protein 84/107 [Dimargaris cristalligena]
MSIPLVVDKFAQACERSQDLLALEEEAGLALIFRDICQEQWDRIHEDQEQNAFPLARRTTAIGPLTLWRAEKNTWDLIHRLYFERLAAAPGEYASQPPSQAHPLDTDHALVQRLFAENRSLSEQSVVRSWLEAIAPPFSPTPARKGYWVYTKNALRNCRSLRRHGPSPVPMVSCLDPDAPIREGLPLHHEDETYEADLLDTLFQYIRRGRLEEAIDLCYESGMPWRAASIRGGLMYHDSQLEGTPLEDGPTGAQADVGGTLHRTLWKASCAQLARDTELPAMERAIYAALAGVLAAVLPACPTWEDQLWAYYTAMLEHQVEEYLNTHSHQLSLAEGAPHSATEPSWRLDALLDNQPLPVPPFPANASAVPTTPAMVFDAVTQARPPGASGLTEQDPYHWLQTQLILNQTTELTEQIASQLDSNYAIQLEPALLAYVAHVVIYLRAHGIDIPELAADSVVYRYIRLLVHQWIAMYTVKLPRTWQAPVYAQYLVGIRGPYEPYRRHALHRAQTAGLNVRQCARLATDVILERGLAQAPLSVESTQTPSGAIYDPVPDTDLDQIRALEWLSFDAELYLGLLLRGNALARQFLTRGRLSSCRALWEMVPEDLIRPGWFNAVSLLQKGADMGLVQEYFHYRNLIKCFKVYNEWAEALDHKPTPADLTDHRTIQTRPSTVKKSQATRLADWTSSFLQLTQQAEEALRRLLESDWLSTSVYSSGVAPDTELRNLQLADLRQRFIPEIVFRLHTVLFESRLVCPDNLNKSLTLSHLVADEQYQLYREFMKSDQLPRLMSRFAQSSMSILETPSTNPFQAA